MFICYINIFIGQLTCVVNPFPPKPQIVHGSCGALTQLLLEGITLMLSYGKRDLLTCFLMKTLHNPV